jgi:hypothetical protein
VPPAAPGQAAQPGAPAVPGQAPTPGGGAPPGQGGMWGGAAGAAAGTAAAAGAPGGPTWTATGPTAEAKQKKSRVPVIVGIVVLALLLGVGVFFLVRSVFGGSDLEITIPEDNCVIEADGTMTVDGTVTSDSDVDTSLEVRFDDAESGEEVDRTTVDVKGDAGDEIPFSATGEAGDDVTRIDCVVVASG